MPAQTRIQRRSISLSLILMLVATLLIAVSRPALAEGHEASVGSVGPTGLWTVPGVDPFYFGIGLDVPFLGDFDGDGVRTPGLYRPSTGQAFVRNSLDTGIADASFYIGDPGDVPVVGDFDGDGVDSFGVFRAGTVYLRNELTTGPADISYSFGVEGDVPFAGDFDGDGIDTVGLHRPASGEVFLGNSQVTSLADHEFSFGSPGDAFVAGDWNGDGIDTVGVVRPSTDTFFFRNSNDQGFAEGNIDFDGDLTPVVPHAPLPATVTLSTGLDGAVAVPGPGDPDGTGEATITISGLELSWSITVRDITAPTAAHIHAGTAGQAGPIIHDLLGNGGPFADDGNGGLLATGALTITAEQAAALAATPGAFYINVHNPDFPPGAIRGNLNHSVM